MLEHSSRKVELKLYTCTWLSVTCWSKLNESLANYNYMCKLYKRAFKILYQENLQHSLY